MQSVLWMADHVHGKGSLASRAYLNSGEDVLTSTQHVFLKKTQVHTL